MATFHGTPRADHHTMEHVHESPKVMTIPLGILAAGAVLAGMLGVHYFVGEGRAEFWRDAIKVLEGFTSRCTKPIRWAA